MNIITDYHETGECGVDIKLLAKKWNHLFWISQYGEEYRLIKHKRKDSPLTEIKCTISKQTALKIIELLELKAYPNEVFRLATVWI